MGKSLLVAQLARQWADGDPRLTAAFEVVLLVRLQDWPGTLEGYIRSELLPSYYDQERWVSASLDR